MGPWRFKNPQMERRFQLDYLDGIADRIAPAFSFILPFTWSSFACLVPMRLSYAHVWSFGEAFITVTRILATGWISVLFYTKWTSSAKLIFGRSLLWINRLCYFLNIAQQCGIQQHDSNTKILFIWNLYFGGAVAPSFDEYILSSVVISYTKPICLWMLESFCANRIDFECTDDGKQQEVVHSSILFGLAVFINFLLYGDHRRDWLFRCASLGKVCAVSSADLSESPCDLLEIQWNLHQQRTSGSSSELDLLGDGYFSPADRELWKETARAEAEFIAESLAETSQLSGIKVRRIIGSGSSGCAHLATARCGWAETVVSKELKTAPRASSRRLLDSLRIFEALRHPNVARFAFAAGGKGRVLFFQEYCAGRSLAFIIGAGVRVDAAAAQHFALHMARGLAYLHRHCVVHNNLKPANCLLAPDATVKLTDYGPVAGGSALLDWRPDHSTLLSLPPEAFRDQRRGRSGDVWSLGCVVLELLTLRTVLGQPARPIYELRELARVGEVARPAKAIRDRIGHTGMHTKERACCGAVAGRWGGSRRVYAARRRRRRGAVTHRHKITSNRKEPLAR